MGNKQGRQAPTNPSQVDLSEAEMRAALTHPDARPVVSKVEEAGGAFTPSGDSEEEAELRRFLEPQVQNQIPPLYFEWGIARIYSFFPANKRGQNYKLSVGIIVKLKLTVVLLTMGHSFVNPRNPDSLESVQPNLKFALVTVGRFEYRVKSYWVHPAYLETPASENGFDLAMAKLEYIGVARPFPHEPDPLTDPPVELQPFRRAKVEWTIYGYFQTDPLAKAVEVLDPVVKSLDGGSTFRYIIDENQKHETMSGSPLIAISRAFNPHKVYFCCLHACGAKDGSFSAATYLSMQLREWMYAQL